MTGSRVNLCRINGKMEVQIWYVRLEASPAVLRQLRSDLSEEETRRAESFRFDSHRNVFITARGMLRALLGSYVREDPAKIRFQYGLHGKPSLVSPDCTQLKFNLSHAGDVVVYAISSDLDVGVDIERIRAIDEADGIARQFFSCEEYLDWHSLPLRQRLEAFFTCWTRKEAYLKMTGGGLSVNPTEFRVSLKPDEPAALLRVPLQHQPSMNCALHDLKLVHGYLGALATRAHDCILLERYFSSAEDCLSALKQGSPFSAREGGKYSEQAGDPK